VTFKQLVSTQYLSMAMTQVAINTLYKTWLFVLDLPYLRQLTDTVCPPTLSNQITNTFQQLRQLLHFLIMIMTGLVVRVKF